MRNERETDGKRARRRKIGTLLKRGRIYYARVITEGRIITRSLDTGDRREAEARFRDFIAPYALGSREAALNGVKAKLQGVAEEIQAYRDSLPALAVADAWTAYENAPGRTDAGESTSSRYRVHFFDFADWLARKRPAVREMRQVTRADAEAFLVDLRKRRSAGTYNKYVVFFRHMWKVLADADEGKSATAERPTDLPAKIGANPWNMVRKMSEEPHTRRELTIDELRRVCESTEGELRLLFAIGIYTGLRLGDCALLEWGSVDLARGMMMTVPRKTRRKSHGRPVAIPIHATLRAMLAETPPAKRRGYVLPQTAEKYKRDAAALSAAIQRHFAANGIQTSVQSESKSGSGRASIDVGFHSLRHTFVSMSANAGAPLAVVQAIVGHATPAMTRHYFHESEAALRGAVAALPDISAEGGDERRDNPSLAAFKAAYNALGPKERKEARAWLESTEEERRRRVR